MSKLNTVILRYKKQNNQLSELTQKYGSDKGSPIDDDKSISGWPYHLYSDFYNVIFHGMKDSVTNVLEIGLGTDNESIPSNMTSNGLPGASLRALRDYFPNANIYGADIDSGVLFEEERIKTFYVDQTDQYSVAEMLYQTGVDKFDIILDDGLHEAHAAITLLEHAYYKLRDGGIYIIEDVKYYRQNIKDYLEGNGYNFIHLDFGNDASECFIIFK
jgi:hypothetical protein